MRYTIQAGASRSDSFTDMLHRHIRRYFLRIVIVCLLMTVVLMIFAKTTDQNADKEELENLNPLFQEYRKTVGPTAEVFYERPEYIKVDPPKASFRVPSATLRQLASPTSYVTLNSQSVKNFVFVTAGSWPFFEEILKTVQTIQEHFPQHHIVFYDLGMTADQKAKISRICRLIYKHFDFTRYPDHVRNLHLYAWKPIAIFEALQDHPGIFWVDSSARFSSSSDVIFGDVIRNNGALFFTTTGHSNFAVTHKRMYDFLPTDLEAMMEIEQRESIVMLYRTKFTYEKIVFWLVMCALDKDCIAPTQTRGCKFARGEKRFSEYANCHRFDQSAVNIIMANAHNFPEGDQLYASVRIVTVDRDDETYPNKVQYC